MITTVLKEKKNTRMLYDLAWAAYEIVDKTGNFGILTFL